MKYREIFEKEGYNLTDEQIAKFQHFYDLLDEWNYKIDITKIVEEEEVYIKHFLDSLLITKAGYFEKNQNIIDIGTGGGFPGVPLKIYNDTLSFVLLDSLKKRINFLDKVVEELKLDNVVPLHGRAEEIARKEGMRESFDSAVSRAVAPMQTLLEYCLPFVKVGGYFIAMKGPNYKDELNLSKGAINLLGGLLDKVIEYELPLGLGSRSLIVIKKIKATPHRFPRAGGKPRSNPLT
ncbi:16S rRNA (guanine(527)-N(7))-methyltransferase GidB [Helcococcus kunzii ATCC 51366]|uniref:Ribosomal RNA small subunit methyltransferase G n=1 Tax=Helcococcus kunzii ATCC 51366 TaxID=883114 RepID=H3NQV0_9FIRM|nr:16S rRNA (guanine(527)-N(7))-methyltransferase RsmG [Helcococcus kunzii]EHR32097.1 16S rRNA (guanine(527)-N(7))-methyltransferase GidB [Helcococcus kunzii ATCC 51366]